jgi:hypothetical protein
VIDDTSIFFRTDEFAVTCVRRRAAEPDVSFAAILASSDEEALDGYALAGEHRLRTQGDRVLVGDRAFEVRQVLRVIDGSESEALLREVAA